MDKNNIQRRINELKVEIYKANLEKKRIERKYINCGNEYIDMYRTRLMKQAASLEAYILKCQTKIDKLREELRKQSNI